MFSHCTGLYQSGGRYHSENVTNIEGSNTSVNLGQKLSVTTEKHMSENVESIFSVKNGLDLAKSSTNTE